MIERISIAVRGQGLHDFTDRVRPVVSTSGLTEGLCTLFIRHTSASLLIQENYDDSARVDLENWLNRLVPENDSLYTHTLEGPDDMPAHIKSALTATQVSVPFQAGELLLGTWQGIYLWEHRHHAGSREVVVHLA
ncbi:MAG: secondary thiamine-phosphate synthase enzyme [Halioglobus sp.]